MRGGVFDSAMHSTTAAETSHILNMSTHPTDFFRPIGLSAALIGALITGVVIGRYSASEKESVAPSTLSATGTTSTASAPTSPSVPGLRSAFAMGTDWESLLAKAPSIARDADAATWLAGYAAHSPEEALARAMAESHRVRRSLWRSAALRGWAAAAPEAVATWIIRQPTRENRSPDIAASFAGTAATPAVAQALARRYAEAFPDQATEHGSLLIAALTDAGQYDHAAQFAIAGQAEAREMWTASAFSHWSEQQPQSAALAAAALPDSTLRDIAWRASVANWAHNEPASLANFALSLPAGESRSYAVGEALRVWIDQDPPAASRWLDRLDPSADTDIAVSMIATQPVLAARRPDVAISWAESIADPTLRSRTLARVVLAWADSDPAAATRYAQSTPALMPADREVALFGEYATPHP